jgi:putative flippase GtrA
MAHHMTSSTFGLLRLPAVRQFVKYCIVGTSSTLLDFGLFLFFMEVVHLHLLCGSLGWGRVAAALLSFLGSVSNGFLWNNRWTFRQAGRSGIRRRYAKFVITNAIGLVLNLLILTTVAQAVPAGMLSFLRPHLHDPAGFVGKLSATLVVVFWNFAASKYWAFKS